MPARARRAAVRALSAAPIAQNLIPASPPLASRSRMSLWVGSMLRAMPIVYRVNLRTASAANIEPHSGESMKLCQACA